MHLCLYQTPNLQRLGNRLFLSESCSVLQCSECGGQTAGTVDHGTLGPAGGCLESLGEKSIRNADLSFGNFGKNK